MVVGSVRTTGLRTRNLLILKSEDNLHYSSLCDGWACSLLLRDLAEARLEGDSGLHSPQNEIFLTGGTPPR